MQRRLVRARSGCWVSRDHTRRRRLGVRQRCRGTFARRVAHRILICIALVLVAAAPAQAQAPRTSPYVNGPVAALLADGDTLYVGGSFTAAGTAAGPLVLAAPDGRIVRTHPGFSGLEVRALAPDGEGGWYAGGTFDRVDGRERRGLVHLSRTGPSTPTFHRRHRPRDGARPRRLHALGRWGAPAGGRRRDRRAAPWREGRAVYDLAIAGERVIVAGPSGLTALDAAGVAWEVAGEVVDIDARGGVVYAAGPSGAVARRATDGGEIVRFAAEEPRAIAAGDGVVVVHGRRLSAFDAATGVDRGWFGDGESVAAGGEAQGGAGAPPSAGRARRAQGERRDVCFSSVLSGSRSNTRHTRAADAGGALAIAGTRLYVAGDTLRRLRPARRHARALVAAAARRRGATRWRSRTGSWPSAAHRAPSTGSRARTWPRSTCAPGRSRPSRRAAGGAVSALLEVGGVLYAGGSGRRWRRWTRGRAQSCRSPRRAPRSTPSPPTATRSTSAAPQACSATRRPMGSARSR